MITETRLPGSQHTSLSSETPNRHGFAMGQILSQHEAAQNSCLSTGQLRISPSVCKSVGSSPAVEITKRILL